MQLIPLAVVPNQKFTITLDGHNFKIQFNLCNGVMAVTINRDGINVISGQRCVAGFPLINYRSYEGGSGNFIFTTLNDSLPDYNQFGTTQFLYYASNEELEAIRG